MNDYVHLISLQNNKESSATKATQQATPLQAIKKRTQKKYNAYKNFHIPFWCHIQWLVQCETCRSCQ